MERDVRTAVRWEKERGLPVHRHPGKRSVVFALTKEIDAWLQAKELPATTVQKDTPTLRRWIPILGTILPLAVAMLLAFRTSIPERAPHLGNPIQLTNDGIPKLRPIPNGLSVFFTGLMEGDHEVPMWSTTTESAVSAALPQWPHDSELAEINQDGSSLLAIRAVPKCDQLWVGSSSNGSLARLGDLCVNAAGWSPDGKALVYASPEGVYTADANGDNPRKLTVLPGRPYRVSWSPDGKRLRFAIEDKRGAISSRLWQVDIDKRISRRLLPSWSTAGTDREYEGHWSPDGKFFVFAAIHEGIPGLWAIDERRQFTLPGIGTRIPFRLTTETKEVRDPSFSRDGKRLFAAVTFPDRGELLGGGPRDPQFRPWPELPGMSAGHVSFSRDGAEAAYTSYPDSRLWKMKADGSERQQLTFNAVQANMPQWSPDGRRIAFMCNASSPMKPAVTKICIIDADGGPIQEPVLWNESQQGIPSWTPDGQGLVFGENDTVWPIRQSCKLHFFDFRTGQTRDLPGTAGLWTARVSPSGRYVAAETRTQDELVLYDLTTATKSTIIRFRDSRVGDNPVWSNDGKYIYIDAPLASDPAVYRIRMTDHQYDRVASLKGIRRAKMGNWIGLTPSGTLLITRRLVGSEIYAWDWIVQ